jgi:hypothetical protein
LAAGQTSGRRAEQAFQCVFDRYRGPLAHKLLDRACRNWSCLPFPIIPLYPEEFFKVVNDSEAAI